MPDVMVVPTAYGEPFRGRPVRWRSSRSPAAHRRDLVVDGEYDVDAKLPVHQQRGDLEIWRIHPYERTLIAWRRQPDGSYEETIHRGGIITLKLPGVEVDLNTLFDE